MIHISVIDLLPYAFKMWLQKLKTTTNTKEINNHIVVNYK